MLIFGGFIFYFGYCLSETLCFSSCPASALIGQFKHTPSRLTNSEAQHTVTHLWSEILKKLMRTELSEPSETDHRDSLSVPLPCYLILWHHFKWQSYFGTSFVR